MKIAVCNDIAEFGGNRLSNRTWAARFPGAGWVAVLSELATARGWEVASGDVALSHVQCGYWQAADVFVIQELDSAWGARLREIGCRTLLLTCLESPLYASLFYDQWRPLADKFPYCMLPVEDASITTSAKAWPLRFPCYWKAQRVTPTGWTTRQAVVLVAANKYWRHQDLASAPPLSRPRSYLQWRRQARAIAASPARRMAQRQQLHDARLEAITALSAADMLALYGSGWDRLSILPQAWQSRMANAKLSYHGKAGDKIGLQAGFRFALCFENVTYPGYVTEKIIEALVAGSIPVYMGAPNITDYVPAAAFIDASPLSSMSELPALLAAITPEAAARMISAGQAFLDSEIGQLHSYEGFAAWIEQLALEQEHAV